MVKQFTQGGESDGELFSQIGKFALSKAVHEQLGVAVTGEPGDVWLIGIKDKETSGFAQVRAINPTTVHLRYLYSDSLPMVLELGYAAIKLAKQMGFETIYANERRDSPMMRDLGFIKTTDSGKTKFCRWESSPI